MRLDLIEPFPLEASTLYVLATPIGNLQDITLRGLGALTEVDFILCEDTRKTRILLERYTINKPLVALHDHNEISLLGKILERLKRGESAALVSDAGMPLISDPGYSLVRHCLQNGVVCRVLPGPSACLTALVASGLPPHPFCFLGFFPHKKKDQEELARKTSSLAYTLIFYESPRRLLDALLRLREIYGERRACVARELTKRYEEVKRGDLSELIAYYSSADTPKGEIVIILEGNNLQNRPSFPQGLALEMLKKLGVRDTAYFISQLTGGSKKEIYEACLSLKAGLE